MSTAKGGLPADLSSLNFGDLAQEGSTRRSATPAPAEAPPVEQSTSRAAGASARGARRAEPTEPRRRRGRPPRTAAPPEPATMYRTDLYLDDVSLDALDSLTQHARTTNGARISRSPGARALLTALARSGIRVPRTRSEEELADVLTEILSRAAR